MSQDLGHDVRRGPNQIYARLAYLLNQPSTESSSRFFSSLRWHNDANSADRDDDAALVSLAIAFEALLGLPPSEKTDRLVDAICLLLGRVPRLDDWARQFYDARSRIVHEGSSTRLRFVVPRSEKRGDETVYQSLMSYGRHVFRICLGTLLAGSELAESVGIQAKLVTNQERFETVCRRLDDKSVVAPKRLGQALNLAREIEAHRFVGESGLRIDTILGAARRAACVSLNCDHAFAPELKVALEDLCSSDQTGDHAAGLHALRIAANQMPKTAAAEDADWDTALRLLVNTAWSYLMMHAFRLPGPENPPAGPANGSGLT
jgi:hypothetical protein